MDDSMTKSKVLSGLFWKLMERGGTQGVQFFLQVILARLLMPKDYGILAIVAIFITIAGIFVQSGLSTALIQKKDVGEGDFSSVFYLSLLISILLYIVLFIASPAIAVFFAEPQLVWVLRIVSLTLLLGAFVSVQYAVIARKMQFKKLFYSSLGAVTISGTTGIAMAYSGYGVWALVGQQLINQLSIVIILWFIVPWRPGRFFSVQGLIILFSFGWKLLVSSLIESAYKNLSSLIIGRLYNTSMLGFYDKGRNIPGMIIINVNGSIQSVMFPAFAFYQDDRERVKSMMRRSITTGCFVIFPMMIGLAAVAEPLVVVLLTDKWLPAVPFIRIFCFGYALWPIHTANLQVINALGRSDIFLKLEIIKTFVGLGILMISIPHGIYAIAFSSIVNGIISSFINAFPNKKLLKYGYAEQLRDIMPSLLLSLAMGSVVFAISLLQLTPLFMLIMQIFAGIVSYVLMAALFRLECFYYLFTTLGGLYKERKIEAVSGRNSG